MEIREFLDGERSMVEAICRKNAQYMYVGEGDGLCRVLSKYLMYVDPRDTSVAPHLMMSGYWEIWITQALARLPRGINCADVGANHGYFSMLLADLCAGEVHAFEPQEGLANKVKKSADLNGFRGRVHVHNAAAGAEAGSTYLALPEGEPLNLGSARCVSTPEGASRLMSTDVVTLDEAVPGELGFIKIDAEGYEPDVWAGMKRHLESRPIILMEFSPERYSDTQGFLQEMASCYTLREVDNGGSVVEVEQQELLDREDFSMLWLEADR